MNDGPEFAAAEWMSGWIALSFLVWSSISQRTFWNFYNNVGYPISTARGAYWLGKTYKNLMIKIYLINGLRKQQII